MSGKKQGREGQYPCGHERTPENTYTSTAKYTSRSCRTCQLARNSTDAARRRRAAWVASERGKAKRRAYVIALRRENPLAFLIYQQLVQMIRRETS